MDLLIKEGDKLGPKDYAEEVALFRAKVIGPLLTREFTSHGELVAAIRAVSRRLYRPPRRHVSRKYSQATIERWYYRHKRGGLDALRPRRRSDAGHARELTDEQRKLSLDIRREHTSASASLIARDARARWPPRKGLGERVDGAAPLRRARPRPHRARSGERRCAPALEE